MILGRRIFRRDLKDVSKLLKIDSKCLGVK
jgi:hypothetical protein